MAKTKAKRNVLRPKLRSCFKICREPVVRLSAAIQSSEVADRMSLPPVCEGQVLFAIARDDHTIFVSWDVDWPSVFGRTMPLDRQVHLRLIAADGFEQKRIAVEPMLGSFYVPVSQSGATYRVELGYYPPDGVWKSVAVSEPVVMPANVPSENTQIDLATVPFHIAFQKLVDLLTPSNGDPLVTTLSHFEERVVTFAEGDVDLRPADREILRALEMSVDDLRSDRVSFAKGPNKLQLHKRAEASLGLAATSPISGFGGNSWNQ
jgi:hypothetical protein